MPWRRQAITWTNVELIIKDILCHSRESSAHELNPEHVVGDYTYKIITISVRGQWVQLHIS